MGHVWPVDRTRGRKVLTPRWKWHYPGYSAWGVPWPTDGRPYQPIPQRFFTMMFGPRNEPHIPNAATAAREAKLINSMVHPKHTKGWRNWRDLLNFIAYDPVHSTWTGEIPPEEQLPSGCCSRWYLQYNPFCRIIRGFHNLFWNWNFYEDKWIFQDTKEWPDPAQCRNYVKHPQPDLETKTMSVSADWFHDLETRDFDKSERARGVDVRGMQRRLFDAWRRTAGGDTDVNVPYITV